jgi:hypothetical protein
LNPWLLAWKRFTRDRLGVACLVVVLIFVAVMAASAAGLSSRLVSPKWA